MALLTALACSVGFGAHALFAQYQYEELIPDSFDVVRTRITPGMVQTSGWSNPTDAIDLDYRSDELYDNFSASHAAVLMEYIASNPAPLVPQFENESAEESVAPNSETDTANNGADESTVIEQSLPDTEQPTQESEIVPEEKTESTPVSEPEPTTIEESVSEETAYKQTTRTFLTFFSAVSKHLPFTNANTTTPALLPDESAPIVSSDESDVPETPSVAETDLVEDEFIESNASSSVEVTTVETPADTTVTADETVFSEEEFVATTTNQSTTTAVDLTQEILPTPEAESGTSTAEYVCTDCEGMSIEFRDFGVGDLLPEHEIINAQLRFSLAAKKNPAASEEQRLEVSYFYEDEWHSGGVFFLGDEEVSNAMNGDYHLFALPLYDAWEEIEELRVRVTYTGDKEIAPTVYLDAAWVEVDSVDHAAFLVQPDALAPLLVETTEVPDDIDFSVKSAQDAFAYDEQPVFRYEATERQSGTFFNRLARGAKNLLGIKTQPKKYTMRVTDEYFEDKVTISQDDGDEYVVEVDTDRSFRPGVYEIELEMSDGQNTFYITQDFSWGVLALNTDKTIYHPHETANLQMGVLDEAGHTVCDAVLHVRVTDPKGATTQLSTNDGTVAYGADCAGDTYIETADYLAAYKNTGEWGTYMVELTAETDNGAYTITDSFEVQEYIPFDITRHGPTRIYPLAPYTYTLDVVAYEAYSGPIIEYVPADFLVVSPDDGVPFATHEEGDTLALIWDVTLAEGESITLSYQFDAPNISPEFYLLGPATVGTFAELRQWHIASDVDAPVVASWSINNSSNSNDASVTVAAPSGIQNGDLLIGLVALDGGGTLGAPAGFTALHAQLSDGTYTYRPYYKIASSESGNYTFTTNNVDQIIGAVIRVIGADQNNPIDVVGSNTGTGASIIAPSVTTTVDNAKIFRFFGLDDNDFTTDTGYPGGHTGLFMRGTSGANGRVSMGAAHATQTSLGTTGTASFTIDVTNEAWGASTVAVAPPQYLTVGSTGNQADMRINTTNNYVGAAFSFSLNYSTANVTNITISDTGTVDAQNDISNVKLFYELDTSAPYNCASETYDGVESQFGSTGSFSGANGSVTFTGSVGISSTAALCTYVVLDVDASANDGDTLELEISNPTTDVVASSGTIDPSIAVALSGTSELVIGFSPLAPLYEETPSFFSMKATTTTPVLGGFAAVDPDGNDVQYEIQIDDTYTFGSPDITALSSDYPTDAGWSAATFSSGATTTYHIQSALTPGVTYWYRARAIDPSNKNVWGAYSEPRSITIGDSLTTPEWYQTTDEQFVYETTRTNATSTGSDQVAIANTNAAITVLDNWSTGATKTISSGMDRLLIISITSEDSGTDVDVGSVTYGGQTVTQISEQQIGTGFSNGMWVGYLDDAGISSAVGTSIAVTWTGSGTPTPDNGIAYASAVFANVDQSSPIRDFSTNALTSGTSITPAASLSVVEGDMVFYVSESTTGVTHTAATGYTEGTEQDTGGDEFTVATAYKTVLADGTEYPEALWSASGNRLLMTAVALRPSPAYGTILSGEIDFDWVSGQNDWGEISWDITEPVGSTAVVQVYYTAATACDTLVPDGVLSGNSSGFATSASPVNISGLSTSTYNRICVFANLNEGSASSSPSLNEWTVSWERKPVYEQAVYHWYQNQNAITPSTAWPSGSGSLAENQPINADVPTEFNDVLRLRMGVAVSSVSASIASFKLQYAASDSCEDALLWNDVAPISSTTAVWRGYNNASVADGATLPSALLAATDVLETYEEANNSTVLPNSIAVGEQAEWDWVLQNQAAAGTHYCFRMVGSDGSAFSVYTVYPSLFTNQSPHIATINAPFDNEKLASTTPWFDFIGLDPEGDEIDYQVQIATEPTFAAPTIDADSLSDPFDFTNLDAPADKSPFFDSNEIRYIPPSSLTNGSTYWWRVRAVDSNNSASYGDWSTPRSFTIDNGVTISTWFQTTEAQFDTDTLIGTDATAADLVAFTSGSTTGTTTSTAINFTDGAKGGANAWGTVTFTETGSANDILYHVEYYTGAGWSLIPDSDLSGNAAGFDTSPVSLLNLDTETYNQIRLRANFRAGSPTLLDWTVTWGLRVSVPTHLLRFDNEKTGTTSPAFTFYTTDPQGDDLEYEFSYSTDYTFTGASTTINSSSGIGFTNYTTGADTTPFNSGDTILYEIQTPLTDNTTYWWRVRARDPLGGNSYSFWSDPWSFTTDTTATTSTWFQTTQEQFDTDTLVSTEALVTDAVSTLAGGVSVYTFAGITGPSASDVARDFEVDVNDPTDPPSSNDIDSLTTDGTNTGSPNLRTALAGYASDAEASTAQYAAIAASDNNYWQITDPGNGDNAVFWAEVHVDETISDISQLDLLLEGYQGGAPGSDKAWFGIWRPGATTPHWEVLSAATQGTDANFTGTITTNISQYFDGNNNIHLIFFNEDVSDSLFVDYVEVQVTSSAASAGTITSTPVDFDDGDGPAWGEFSWNETLPGASSISYQLEYLTGAGTWAVIPNSALSGNESGFTTGPVDLKALNTTVYNELRAVANLTCSGVNCPVLNDWTIEWSRGFTISGTAYEYDGVTPTTAGTVAVAVNGELQIGKTGTISGGSWSISNVTFFAGDVITVFVTGAADADEAVGVTVYDGTPDLPGMQLQKRHLTIGSNDLATVSNLQIGQYDFTDTEDVFFNVDVSNTLSLCADAGCADAGIVILQNNTYAPGVSANVLTHDMHNHGTLTGGSNNIRVQGSWDNTGTTSLANATVIFTATSGTETVDGTGAVVDDFGAVQFGEISGTATWMLASPLDINGNLTVAYGTLARSTEQITVTGNLSTQSNGFWSGIGTTTFDGGTPAIWTDTNTTHQNIGHAFIDGSTKAVTIASDTTAESVWIATDDAFDLDGYTITVLTNWVNEHTFTPRGGEVVMAATAPGHTIATGGAAFYDLTFAGVSGVWSFIDANVTVSNDLTIATGTVTLPTATTTIGGSFVNTGGTFVHNNGELRFTGTGTEVVTALGTQFTNTFGTVSFAGSGSWTFTDVHATTTNDIYHSAGAVLLPSGTLAVGGSFTTTGGVTNSNGGTVRFFSAGTETVRYGGATLHAVTIAGSGNFTITDTNASQSGDLLITAGSVTFPTGTFSVGGSFINQSTFAANNGTVALTATSGGKQINPGASSFANLSFIGGTGGWTIASHATATNNVSFTAADTITVASGQTLSVGGVFTNELVNASTTWTGATLALESGAYSINTKTNTGDSYNIMRIAPDVAITMWNSDVASLDVAASGSLYSADHAGVDGALYIWGAYTRTAGTEYWSYTTDFDGTDLTGGGERAAVVSFADGATATIATSSLDILGAVAASTTIQSQGGGTYAVTVQDGVVNARYYEFSNLDTSGVALLGSTTITSLRDGAYIPGTALGTGLTVAAATIDTNPALQIYNVRFATTSAIAAYNVTQTDALPSSYWWFRNSTGNFDGEAFDNDSGDPGSIRWDDSSLVITVSGVVYTDDGVTPLAGGTCDGVSTPVTVVVSGGAAYSGTCSAADGSFSIPGVVIVGDPVLTTYLNDAVGGEQAVTVTKTPTANITDLDLYQNYLVTRHEDVASLTIADLAVFDITNDNDVFYSAATGTTNSLTVSAERSLYIWKQTTFDPEGVVTLEANATGLLTDGSLLLAATSTFNAYASSTYTIGGSLFQAAGATFNPASSTVLMTATTTGKAIVSASNESINFNQLTFAGLGGGWNIAGNLTVAADMLVATGTVTGTGTITVTNGSFYGDGVVSLGGGEVLLAKTNTLGGVTPWTFHDLTLGNGAVVGTTTPASAATTTIGGVLTIAMAHTLDAGSAHLAFTGAGTVFVETGVFAEDTSTVTYRSTTNLTVTPTAYYDLVLDAPAGTPTYNVAGPGVQVFSNLLVGVSGDTVVDLNTSDPVLAVSGDVTIGSFGTMLASNSSDLTIAGSYTNVGTFTHNNGTVTFNGSGSESVAAGTSDFGSVQVAATGDLTFVASATSTGAFTIANANTFTVASSTTLTVTGTFANQIGGASTVWTGSTLRLAGGANYEINASSTADIYATLAIAGTTHIRMWNSEAATYVVESGSSLYSMDHANVNGNLAIYGDYRKGSGTDYWSYATDFDGTPLGGAARAVQVAIAGGGSVAYTGTASLAVLGVASASTTIANQGSGEYAFTVGGSGTANFRYYTIQNTDTQGLTFTGSVQVSDLSYGEYTVGNDTYSAITVGGTAITASPARTFTRNIFTRGGGVSSAYNVTATGTTVSSWRFTNHTGNLAGEAYDLDPDGDPGYIVWDDSAASITIAGVVYSDEGTTAMGAGVCDGSYPSVTIVVAGLTTYTTSCASGSATYAVSGITYSPGDSIAVYLTPTGSERAAAVTVDPVSNINNMDLYQNRVIVRHEGTDPIAITDLAVWDSTDDGYVPFTATAGAPDTIVLPANRKLLVWNDKTFAPGGNVTVSGGGAGAAYDGTLALYPDAQFIAQSGELHTIGGSLVADATASLVSNGASFTFTTSASGRTIAINGAVLGNTTFAGSGDWAISDPVFTVDDLTMTQGVVTLPSATTTVNGSLLVTGGAFVHSNGMMEFAGAGTETITAAGSDFAQLSISGNGTYSILDTAATATISVSVATTSTLSLPSGTLTVGGDFINAGTLVHNAGTLAIATSGPAIVRTNGADLGSLTVTNGGVFTLADANLTLAHDLTVVSGSLTLATGTLAIGGSWNTTGGSFAHASGTVLFNSTDIGETINPGASSFAHVSFAGPTGGWTIGSDMTTLGDFALTSANSFTVNPGVVITVNGVFSNSVGGVATTWTDSTLALTSGTDFALNTKNTGGDVYGTLQIAAGMDLRMWNSSAATTTLVSTSTSSLYSQDHSATDGYLYIYGTYTHATSTLWWTYDTDFDGSSLSGSERPVHVYLVPASGASFTQQSGTLLLTGASGATTTVQAAGTGTYEFMITGGSVTAEYYSFADMNSDGLQLSGTPLLSNFSNGAFTVGVTGGTAMTLSSTTLNANASKVISGVVFATTSPISAYNVTLIGDTISAWRFLNSTGNLAGEAFDVDGATACGSVRWNNSACLLVEQTNYRWRNDDGGTGVPTSEWYNANWGKRRSVRIANSDASAYTNAAIELSVSYDADMQSDFDDLRFTASDGITPLSYFRASTTNGVVSEVWVEVPTVLADSVSTIYMYYDNPTATSSSNAVNTFVAADSFQDGSLSEYSGETVDFTVGTSFAYDGTYGLDASGNESGRTESGGIFRFDQTINQGQTIRYMQYVDTTAGSGDEVCTMFGVQSPGTTNENYAVCIEQFATDRISLVRDVVDNDASAAVTIDSTPVTYTTGWYEVEVKWGSGGTFTVTLSRAGATVATLSGVDSTYSSGGYGFTFWFQNGGWDTFMVRPTLTTEPTVFYGGEAVSGGASYRSSQNSTGVYRIDDIARLRIAVENSGLPITNQNFDIEYAAKGSAPSCESIDGSAYQLVPTQVSCGSSPICMQASGYVTNGAATADLLLGISGTYVAGQSIESPSNTTSALDLGQDTFTEIEYALTPTDTVSDTNYCFRVTDSGSELDSYLSVAELELVFPPQISSLSLNGGLDIALSPGATTTVYATGTVSDLNGFADLAFATTTVYRSGVSNTCSDDPNNCYVTATPACSFVDCAGNSCTLSCAIDMYYFAEPTDVGTFAGETWRAYTEVADISGDTASGTAPSIDLLTLNALTLTDGATAINYGTLEVGTTTGSYNATTTIENIGNGSIDLNIEGTDLASEQSSTIDVSQQRFASSTFTYTACAYCTSLSDTVSHLEVDLFKPTSYLTPVTADVYWGIAIPFGTAGTSFQGSNTFYAASD